MDKSSSRIESTRYVLIENCRTCRETQAGKKINYDRLQQHKWTAVIIALILILLEMT